MGRIRAAFASVLALSLLVIACVYAPPCLVWTDDIRPLLIGTMARVPTGEMVGSDCNQKADPTFVWSSDDVDVVQVTQDGVIRAIAPGIFHVTATRGPFRLSSEGFVLPGGWTVKILPASATVRVGESVSFRVVAHNAGGQEISGIPFSIYTPEFSRPGSGERPLVDRYSYQDVRVPATFRAERVGQTTLTGVIGRQSIAALLTIVPTDGKP